MFAIADVAVVVSDAKASAKWWNEKLGFVVHTMPGTGHGILVAPPGERLILHLCEGFAPVEPGNSGIAFVTEGIETRVHQMKAAGVAFPEPLTKAEWGGMAKFADPDGNIFWLFETPTARVQATLKSRAPDAPTRRRPVEKKVRVRARQK